MEFFERYQASDQAVLVHIDFNGSKFENSSIEEFEVLAKSCGLSILHTFDIKKTFLDSKYLIGKGKLSEISDFIGSQGSVLVVFNFHLTPSQERELECFLKSRVIDRTSLILDVFASRARTYEGKLQVELAQLRHLSTRLVRGWSHLERQKGGIGLRGPGEKQLETDKRLIGYRIKAVSKKLKNVVKQREQTRKSRINSRVPVVSLVGYTNAGKSTLLNKMTNSDIYAADQLFATLDPTFRKYKLAKFMHCVLADTVGFISNIPHELILSFNATLQEIKKSDLILHVIDANDPQTFETRLRTVNSVLSDIGANDIPLLHVYNKIDVSGISPRIEYSSDNRISSVWVSSVSQSNESLYLLNEAIIDKLNLKYLYIDFSIPGDHADYLSLLASSAEILGDIHSKYNNYLVKVKVSEIIYKKLLHNTKGKLENFVTSCR